MKYVIASETKKDEPEQTIELSLEFGDYGVPYLRAKNLDTRETERIAGFSPDGKMSVYLNECNSVGLKAVEI